MALSAYEGALAAMRMLGVRCVPRWVGGPHTCKASMGSSKQAYGLRPAALSQPQPRSQSAHGGSGDMSHADSTVDPAAPRLSRARCPRACADNPTPSILASSLLDLALRLALDVEHDQEGRGDEDAEDVGQQRQRRVVGHVGHQLQTPRASGDARGSSSRGATAPGPGQGARARVSRRAHTNIRHLPPRKERRLIAARGGGGANARCERTQTCAAEWPGAPGRPGVLLAEP